MAMVGLYAGLVERRALTGGFFDMDARHFESIARLDSARFFQVVRDGTVGAMACGAVTGGALHMLHTSLSPEGLTWNASYLLMHGLQTYARARGILVMMGGLPRGSLEGLRIFKARWANRFEPVYMLKIVNDPALYAHLCSGRGTEPDFFPAYRTP